MAIYLGDTKVTPSITNTIERVITQNQQGTIISDVTNEVIVTEEDPDNRTEDLPTVTEWTRPSGWPNLDSLPALTEGVYLTFDNRNTVDYKWASFYCVMNTGSYRVAVGHVSGSTWTQDAYWDIASSNYKEVDYSSYNYDYVVFKITPASTNHIQQFYFARVAQATLGTIVLRPQQANRCLERVGKLPYLTTTAGSGDSYRYCCEWMERDKVEFGNAVTSLAAAWYRGRKLKKIEFGNWTGENCNITTIASAFEQCNTIEKIDLSQWKTYNWHITTAAQMFYYCFTMKICIVPFDTTSWGSGTGRTLQIYSMWNGCWALENLDLSSWNMTGINVTRIDSCWYNCYHLKSLNVKNWNTSSWKCNEGNSLYCVFYNCRRLVDIDLSGWDTHNWAPLRADNMFYYNANRRNFDDIKYWDTSNWKIKQFNDAFAYCWKVQELDLSHWNTSGWAVTSLSNTFGSMYSVRHIKVGTWNTSNWAVTNINYLFVSDLALEELECFNWDTSNWPVTNGFYQMFMDCFRIKEVDFTNWDTTKFNLKADGACDLRYCFRNCMNLKKINMSNINVVNVNSLTYYSQNAAGSRGYSPFAYCYTLEELTLPQNYAGHIDFTELYLLPRTELVKAFNALKNPPIANTAKVWIYGMRYKLTTTDIAIATNKGYTVVQS